MLLRTGLTCFVLFCFFIDQTHKILGMKIREKMIIHGASSSSTRHYQLLNSSHKWMRQCRYLQFVSTWNHAAWPSLAKNRPSFANKEMILGRKWEKHGGCFLLGLPCSSNISNIFIHRFSSSKKKVPGLTETVHFVSPPKVRSSSLGSLLHLDPIFILLAPNSFYRCIVFICCFCCTLSRLDACFFVISCSSPFVFFCITRNQTEASDRCRYSIPYDPTTLA